jgi:type IX secretion system PorP/SprF family membrane protein
LLYRNQWAGFTGAPKYYAANINVPVNQWHTAFGATIIAETRGLIKQSDILLNASVDVKLSDNTFLAFGLSGGFESINLNTSKAITEEHFSTEILDYNRNKALYAMGLNLFAHDLHVGASAFLSPFDPQYHLKGHNYSLFINASYLLTANSDLMFKPTALYKHYAGMNDFDIGVFALYKDIAWIGLTHRINKAAIILVDFKITDFMRIAYSIDIPASKLATSANNSHEISLEFTIARKTKQFDRFAN